MILSVAVFKDKYLRDKVEEMFTDTTRVDGVNTKDVMSDEKIEAYIEEAETRVKIDTQMHTLPDEEPFRYAVAMYVIANKISSGIVRIHSEDDTYINTYYANYKSAIKRLVKRRRGIAFTAKEEA
jgi:hypothetical protein